MSTLQTLLYFGIPTLSLFLYLFIGIRQWRNKSKQWNFMDKFLYIASGLLVFGVIFYAIISSY